MGKGITGKKCKIRSCTMAGYNITYKRPTSRLMLDHKLREELASVEVREKKRATQTFVRKIDLIL